MSGKKIQLTQQKVQKMINKKTLQIIIALILPFFSFGNIELSHVQQSQAGDCTGNVVFQATGNAGPFEVDLYQIVSGSEALVQSKEGFNGTGYFTSLCAGQYKILVTDRIGCQNELLFSTIECTTLSLVGNDCPRIFHPTSCNATDGSIRFIGNCFEPASSIVSSFLWSTGETQGNIENLESGTYSLTVTYDQACSEIFNFALEGPSIQLYNQSYPTCSNSSNGSIDLSVVISNNSGSLTYQWSNGESNQDLSDLSSGTYCVTVTLDGSCNKEACFIVEELNNSIGDFNIQSNILHPCQGNNGEISTSITGPFTLPLTYEWQSPFQINASTYSSKISGLPSGDYFLTVTDYCGSSSTQSWNLNEDSKIKILAQYNACSSNAKGGIEIGPVSEPLVKVFSWYLNDDYQSSGHFYKNFDLSLGDYSVKGISTDGCEVNFSFGIDQNSNSNAQAKILPSFESVNCDQHRIDPNIIAGNAPLIYRWFKCEGFPDNNCVYFSDQPILEGIDYGLYKLIVSDGCFDAPGDNTDEALFDFRCICNEEFLLSSECPFAGFYDCALSPKKEFMNAFFPDINLSENDPMPGKYQFTWLKDNLQYTGFKVLDQSFEFNGDIDRNFWGSQTIKVNVKDPKGCDYDIAIQLASSTEIVVFDGIDMAVVGTTGPSIILTANEANLFGLTEGLVVQTDCGKIQVCNSNGPDPNPPNIIDIDNFEYLPIDVNNPCRGGGIIKCSLNPDVAVTVPQNSIAMSLNPTPANKCGCLFPKQLWPYKEFYHPIFVQFDCVEPEDPMTIVDEIDIDPEHLEDCIDIQPQYLDGNCDIKIWCIDEWGFEFLIDYLDGPNVLPTRFVLTNGECYAIRSVCNCKTAIDPITNKEILCDCENEPLNEYADFAPDGTITNGGGPSSVVFPFDQYSCDDPGIETLQTWQSAVADCPQNIEQRIFEIPINEFPVAESKVKILVYPNPFHNQINIMIDNLPIDQEYRIALYDMLGKQIVFKDFVSSSSKLQMEIDNFDHLASGIYSVFLLKDSQILYSEKLVKQ